jgi:LL-diaminopimelate aminotransferase
MQTADRLEKIPPYLFVQMRNKIRETKAKGIDVISLAIGDPDQPTEEPIIKELCRAAIDPENHRYPTDEEKGMLAFRQAVAGWYGRRHGVNLDPETEVLALIGSKEGNHHLALAFMNPGEYGLVTNPGYTTYRASTWFAGGEIHNLPILAERGFLPNLADVPSAVAKKAKILWVNYPNNPTGAMATKEFYQEAIAFCQEHNIILASDNPYSEIVYDGKKSLSILEIPGAKEVAVEFNSLSKPYNMTGWRIGMAVGNPDLIAGIAKVKENTDSGIFNAVQFAGIQALSLPDSFIDQTVATYQRRRDIIVQVLHEKGIKIDKPKATFYIWFPVPAGFTSAQFAEFMIEKAGIVITPGNGYGTYGEGFCRISLTINDARFNEAITRIRKIKI